MNFRIRLVLVAAVLIGCLTAVFLLLPDRALPQVTGSIGTAGKAAIPDATELPAPPLSGHPSPASASTQEETPLPPAPEGPPTAADVLETAGDLSDPEVRAKAVEAITRLEEARREDAHRRAKELGLPIRIVRPDGTIQELVGFEGDRPIYFTTHNSTAAISTGANSLRSSPFSLSGADVAVGMWDGGSGRASHQEFNSGSRMMVKDSSASIDHATHVGGTIAAAGVSASARGMAPGATIDSYDWNYDKSEMTARAAAAPDEAGMLYLSNHSYGYVSGWTYVNGGSPLRVWEWWGSGTSSSATDPSFGRYNNYSRDSDALAFSAPYFLMFRSAGNERPDNPSSGETVALTPGGSSVLSYSSSLHPKGDGSYRGGFETISFDALAKNVITVGSITDAVTSGVRDPAKANISSFSSWGPTDDGRIKPDIVANGDGVYSSLNSGNAAYGSYSGTSMATPNATGTAALLIEDFRQHFPGKAMRASTLKGLLIHTADDRGNPGPDYKYGWGLLNGVEAADLIRDHAQNPLKVRLTEGLITSSTTTLNHEFIWDGASPIHATLSWTDPAGTATTTSDLRTPRLRNDLDLKIVGPAGSEHLPYVMPFVGNWSQAAMDLPATTGKNSVDNVEQVFLAAPPAPGAYRCVVTFSGTLANNQQPFSLLISGSANEEPPPPALTLSSVAPDSALPGTVTVDLAGTGFESGTTVTFQRSGHDEIPASGVALASGGLRCQLDLANAASGAWDVKVENPDGETFLMPAAFTVIGALWSESFDGSVTGWTSNSTTGSTTWSLTNARSHSPTTSFFAPGPASKSTCNLTTPAIAIPANGTNLQFKFWHSYQLENGRDGGRLEFSINDGSWFDVAATDSGAVFASNGYNTKMTSGGGPPHSRNEFAGLAAWSGNSNGFIETIVNLTDTNKFAGNQLRARWRLATNNSTTSPGWYVDSVAMAGGGDTSNLAPVIITSATASSTEAVTEADGSQFFISRGQDEALSVVATDDGGEAALTYTWTGSNDDDVPVSFTANGTHAAQITSALFEATGDYVITVTVRDALGLATASSINVRVAQTPRNLTVAPAIASGVVGGQQAFTATLLDQFGEPLDNQPSSYSWTASGGGNIGPQGLFTATTAGGPYVVSAVTADFTGIASITVNPAPATVTLDALTHVYDGSPKLPTIITVPAGLPVELTYNGSAVEPSLAGDYQVSAAITDPNFQGSATGTLGITKAAASITLEGLEVVEDGLPKEVAAATQPSGLAVRILYDGSETSPVTAGSYPVLVTIEDANYEGETTAVLTITPAEEQNPYELWSEEHFTAEEIAEGFAAADADSDGDGTPNLAEFHLKLDPKDPSSKLEMVIHPGPSLAISRVVPAGQFVIDSSATADGDWTPWRTLEIAQDAADYAVEIPADLGAKHFFRLRYLPPP